MNLRLFLTCLLMLSFHPVESRRRSATERSRKSKSTKAKRATCQELLSGEWTYTSACHINKNHRVCGTKDEEIYSKQYLNLDVDEDCLLTGIKGYQGTIVNGNNADGKTTKEDEEAIIGYYDSSTNTLHLVEAEESGTLTGYLNTDGTLSLIQTQPGSFPLVGKFTYEKRD